MFCRKCFAENVLQKKFCKNVLQKMFCRKSFAKMFDIMFCEKVLQESLHVNVLQKVLQNVFQKMFCKNVLHNVLQKSFAGKPLQKCFAKSFAKISLSQRSFPETVFFFFPFSRGFFYFQTQNLKNTSSLLVLHYQYPQQCGDRSHQVDDQEYLWPRPENAKGCSLCFLREINRTNFLRQYVYFVARMFVIHGV